MCVCSMEDSTHMHESGLEWGELWVQLFPVGTRDVVKEACILHSQVQNYQGERNNLDIEH